MSEVKIIVDEWAQIKEMLDDDQCTDPNIVAFREWVNDNLVVKGYGKWIGKQEITND